MGASFADLFVGAVTGGGAGGFEAYGKSLAKQQEFTMQSMLEDSKALREEHMAEVNSRYRKEEAKYGVELQTAAEQEALQEGGYKSEYERRRMEQQGQKEAELVKLRGQEERKTLASGASLKANERVADMQSKIQQAEVLISKLPQGEQQKAREDFYKVQLGIEKKGGAFTGENLVKLQKDAYDYATSKVDADPRSEKLTPEQRNMAITMEKSAYIAELTGTGVAPTGTRGISISDPSKLKAAANKISSLKTDEEKEQALMEADVATRTSLRPLINWSSQRPTSTPSSSSMLNLESKIPMNPKAAEQLNKVGRGVSSFFESTKGSGVGLLNK